MTASMGMGMGMDPRSELGRPSSAPAHARPARTAIAWAIAGVLVVLMGAGVGILLARPWLEAGSAAAPASTPTPTTPPTPPPLSAAQQLLVDAQDGTACAVTFAGDGIDQAPMLQSEGSLYQALPIPTQEGAVFAGWYATPDAAAAYDTAARVNGSDLVACVDQEIELFGAWMSPERNAAEEAAIPILMYHQFTARPEGEDGWLRGNYAYIGDFDAHIGYIAEQAFYLPTWDELSAFIDGRLFLPNHSVIVTDDDAHPTWLELAVPVVEKHGVLATSFVITRWRSEGSPGRYVLQRSHTHDMHEAGANGDGRMVNYPADQIAADLEQSAQILGAKEIIAYPFGHYNDTAKAGVAAAGFEMARTIEQGYVRIGTDKLALPCIRINYGMTVDNLAALIG